MLTQGIHIHAKNKSIQTINVIDECTFSLSISLHVFKKKELVKIRQSGYKYLCSLYIYSTMHTYFEQTINQQNSILSSSHTFLDYISTNDVIIMKINDNNEKLLVLAV